MLSDFVMIILLTLPLVFAGGLVLFMATGRESKPTTQDLLKHREAKRRSELSVEESTSKLAPNPNQPSNS